MANYTRESRHIHYIRHRPSMSYAASFGSRLYSYFLAPVIVILLVMLGLWYIGRLPAFDLSKVSLLTLLEAMILSVLRLTVAYLLALVVAVPVAILVTKNSFFEHILLPFFDILESIPVLAFFPLIVLVFVRSGYLNFAAIFILFLSMLWNIVFSLVGGLRVIPTEMEMAASVFGIKGDKFIRWVTIPSVMPYLVTGSLLAWAQGWNVLIVAEVLHTYIPHGTAADDLLGLGNLLVKSSAEGQGGEFLYILIVLTAVIALMNFFIWQKLLRYAERFRFE